jgi:alpha-D-ribose 1-methylphosphonate 5-triphosphate synthase subunit PhnH
MKTAADLEPQVGESNGFLRVQVKAFQAVFQAMAFPGRIVSTGITIPTPVGLNSASAAICLTWLNTSTPLWTDIPWDAPAVHWIRSHSEGTLVTEPCLATLALINEPANMPPVHQFRIGGAGSGSVSTTLVIQVNELRAWIDTECSAASPEPPGGFRLPWLNAAGRPVAGVDILLTFRDCILAPRKPAAT